MGCSSQAFSVDVFKFTLMSQAPWYVTAARAGDDERERHPLTAARIRMFCAQSAGC
jgi:hypothetical protein